MSSPNWHPGLAPCNLAASCTLVLLRQQPPLRQAQQIRSCLSPAQVLMLGTHTSWKALLSHTDRQLQACIYIGEQAAGAC